jgi:outer membrane protein
MKHASTTRLIWLMSVSCLAFSPAFAQEKMNLVAPAPAASPVDATPAPSARRNADTFTEALRATYQNNPEIKARRQSLQATDEGVAQAASGFRPTISGQVDYGRSRSQFGDEDWNYNTGTDKSLSLNQPLFRGGSTVANLNSARQQVKAGQYQLDAVEQGVLLDAITAYMAVVQAQAILELSRNNEEVLARQRKATGERFDVGDVTRTDVAQSDARLSDARAATITAEGALISAIATFERIVGYKPEGNLSVPQAFPQLPANLDEALVMARNANPNLLSAIHAEKSSKYDVNSNIGTLLPQVSLVGAMAREDNAGASGSDEFKQDSLLVSVNIPLYQSGAEYSRVREAKARERQRREEVINSRITVQETTTRAWEGLETSIATITSREDQIRAAEIALDGVRQEQEYGARTVLDVLDAEQELFNARTNLVRAQRDRIVAIYNLINTLGQLTPENLSLGINSYDPDVNYDDVKWQFIGF